MSREKIETPIGYIPNTWIFQKLSELTNKITDGAHYSPITAEGGLPIATVENMEVNSLDIKSCRRISNSDFDKLVLNNCSPMCNDVLLSKDGTIGKVIVYKQKDEIVLLSSIAIIRVDSNKLFPDFLKFLLQSDIFYWNLNRFKSGSAIKRIVLKDINNLEFPIPTLPEQQKIASILSSVDEAIEKTEQIIAKTEEVKKGLMQELLTKGIGHTEFKDSEVGELPTEWEVVTVSSFCNVIRGASPRPKGDPRYYGGKVPRLMGADVTRDKKYVTPRLDFLTKEGAKLSRPMKKGDFVVVCSGTVGLPAILAVDACIHDGFLALKDIKPTVSKEYLYYIFTKLRQQLDAQATHGGVFTNLTTQIIKDFKIALPSFTEQEEIASIIKQIDDKLDIEKSKLNKLKTLKQGLMQQLLTGQVRVKLD